MRKKKGTDIMMVGGDFNAAMGGPNDQDKVCGPHSLSNTNNAGQELRNMMVMHGMFSPVTFFKSKHCGSWRLAYSASSSPPPPRPLHPP